MSLKRLLSILGVVAIAFMVGMTLGACEDDSSPSSGSSSSSSSSSTASGGVLMQGFYWDVPTGGNWYNIMAQNAKAMADAGITAIWIPPVQKSDGGGYSMGYNPYDHYDIGMKWQKGTVETRFGSRVELTRACAIFRANGLDVYADMVLNHMSGGDYQEESHAWTSFQYVDAYGNWPGGRFPKTYWDFRNYSGPFGPELKHDSSYVKNGLKDWGDWLTKALDLQGYRLDYVKGYSWDFQKWWINQPPMAGKFAVGELWDENVDYLNSYVNYTGIHAFDFALWGKLKAMCNDGSGGFWMGDLAGAGLVGRNPGMAVTFVENHDTDHNHPITRDKLMAYAYILTHEGYPTVFWRDYFDYGLKDKINNLLWVYRKLAAGSTSVLYTDGDLYIAQRNGWGDKPGLVVVINDNSSSWKGHWVKTKWANTKLHCYAWGSSVDGSQPQDKWTDGSGWVELWAAPRGYAVYAPDGYGGSAANTASYYTTQEIWGAQDLDIAPADGTLRIIGSGNSAIDSQYRYQKIYVQSGTTITAQIWWDTSGWSSSSKIYLALYDPYGSRKKYTYCYRSSSQPKTISYTATSTGWWYFKIKAYNAPKTKFWLKVTYKAPKTL